MTTNGHNHLEPSPSKADEDEHLYLQGLRWRLEETQRELATARTVASGAESAFHRAKVRLAQAEQEIKTLARRIEFIREELGEDVHPF